MQLLIFQAGNARYGLDVRDILEIAPLAACRELPHAPPFVLGLLNYQGCAVPVIDVVALLTGIRANALLSTRLILVRYRAANEAKVVGLVAEKAIETIRCESHDIQPPALLIPDAPWIGGTITTKDGLIQCVTVHSLLGKQEHAALFATKEAA